MKNTNRKDAGAQFLVLSAVFCIVLAALSVLNFMNIRELDEEIRLEAKALRGNNERLNFLRKLKELESDLEYTFEVLKKQIPSSPEDFNIIRQIEAYSSGNSSEFVKIQFGDYKNEADINSIPLTLTFTGRYSNLLKLINEIMSGERLYRIDSIRIERLENSDIRADIEAFAFYK